MRAVCNEDAECTFSVAGLAIGSALASAFSQISPSKLCNASQLASVLLPETGHSGALELTIARLKKKREVGAESIVEDEK